MDNLSSMSFTRVKISQWPFTMSNPNPWEWRRPKAPNYHLWVILQGQGQIWIDGIEYPMESGRAFTFGPEQSIRAQSPGGLFHHFACDFLPMVNDKVAVTAKELPMNHVAIKDIALFYDLCAMAESCALDDNRVSWQQAENILWLLLSMMWTQHSSGTIPAHEKQFFAQAARIKHHPEESYSVDSLAAEVGLSPSQYGRIFKKLFKLSPIRYVLDCKMKKAVNLLDGTSLEISAISDILGYKDIFFFSRQFKKLHGSSPSQFRQRNHGLHHQIEDI